MTQAKKKSVLLLILKTHGINKNNNFKFDLYINIWNKFIIKLVFSLKFNINI